MFWAGAVVHAATSNDFAMRIVPQDTVLEGIPGTTVSKSIDLTVTLDTSVDRVDAWQLGAIVVPAAGVTMRITEFTIADDVMAVHPWNKPAEGVQTEFYAASDLFHPAGKAGLTTEPVSIEIPNCVALTHGVLVDFDEVWHLGVTTGFETLKFSIAVTSPIATAEKVIGEVVFTDALGNPPFPTGVYWDRERIVPATQLPARILAAPAVCKPSGPFTIRVQNAPVDPMEGGTWKQTKMGVLLNLNADGTMSGAQVQGWSYSVCADDLSKAKAVAATTDGTETATVNAGNAPGWNVIRLEPDGAGVSRSVVIDYTSGTITLPAKNGYLDLIMTVEAGLPAPTDEANPPKAFFHPCSEVFGSPPVWAVMIVGGASIPMGKSSVIDPSDCCNQAICNQAGYVYSVGSGPQSLCDDFDQRDGTPAQWTPYFGNWQVAGGKLMVTCAPGENARGETWIWAGNPATPIGATEFSLNVNLSQITADDVGAHGGLMFFASEPTHRWVASGYEIDWIDRASDHGYRFLRSDKGTHTVIGGPTYAAFARGTHWRVVTEGERIKFYSDGQLVFNVVDATYREGYFALWTYCNTTRAEYDNVVLGRCGTEFRRGDANADSKVDIGDAISVLSYLFGTAGDPSKAKVRQCLDAGDANDDGKLDIADAIAVLSHLFAHAGPLKAPFGTCGPDPTGDALDCAAFSPCAGP